jgi:hypothetical protein
MAPFQAAAAMVGPEIYPRDVWVHPYQAVMAMGIESDVSPRNPRLLHLFISFFVLLPRTRSTALDVLLIPMLVLGSLGAKI